jgi:hypothetical protein
MQLNISTITDRFKPKAVLYTSIDELPMDRWRKIHKDGKLHHLVKYKGVVSGTRLTETWSAINDEFVDCFGIPDGYKKILRLKRDISVLRDSLIISEDKSIKTFIKIKAFQLNKLLNPAENIEPVDTDVMIEKYLGREIDEKIISVKKYYKYLFAIKNNPPTNG